jgi:quinol monooxygenase YgiN
MFVSRLTFNTLPGHTDEVEQQLKSLQQMVTSAGGEHPRVLRSRFASLGAPDIVFEQDAADLATLESQIEQVASSEAFRSWSEAMSPLLAQSPKREIYGVRS